MIKLKKKRNLKQITKLHISSLTIGLALLLVPTTIQSKECLSPLKYDTSAIYNMVTACFQHLNMNSLKMFGLPIIAVHGLNQCACITTKIRINFECAEDYMMNVTEDVAGPILGEYSKQCILEGAMGEAARKAYIGASTDNKTIEKEEKFKKNTGNKNPVTWDDLINK
jgi:hypothetical protein